MKAEIPREFQAAASEFAREHLPFLDRNWLYDVFERVLGELLDETVKKHTSTTGNTELREACKAAISLVDNAKAHMPYDFRKCRCEELNDGEHRPQPICHWCSLGTIKQKATKALETP